MWREFVLASMMVTDDDGFPDVLWFLVMDRRSGFPIGFGDSKAVALAQARDTLQGDRVYLTKLFAKSEQDVRATQIRIDRERVESESQTREEQSRHVLQIDKKREQVFNGGSGKCHYCLADLEIHGEWHVDHRIPRSRGGSNKLHNLVAACARCNLKKSSRTEEEFIAKQSSIKAVK